MLRISLVFVLGVCLSVIANEVKMKEPAPEFSRHSIVKIPNFRVKRNVIKAPTVKKELSLPFILNGKNIILDLKLNTDFIVKNPGNSKNSVQEEELCEYIGKVRGVQTSRVAMSVCGDPASVQGTVFDGTSTFYIEPATNGDKDTVYYVYNRRDLIKKRHKRSILPRFFLQFGRSMKRDQPTAQVIPKKNAVLRILLVVGATVEKAKAFGNSKSLSQYCRRLMNEVYSFYSDLGVTVKLAGVKQIFYAVESKIVDKDSGEEAAPVFHFRDYLTRNNLSSEFKYDAAVFLSEEVFAGVTTVGLAFTGSICTRGQQNSIGVISSKGSSFLTSTTVAHEVGHILGLHHEEEESATITDCPHRKNKFIMSAVGEPDEGKWSACSKHAWEGIVKSGRVECLMGESPKPDIWKGFKY